MKNQNAFLFYHIFQFKTDCEILFLSTNNYSQSQNKISRYFNLNSSQEELFYVDYFQQYQMNKQIQTNNFNIKLNLQRLYIQANHKLKLHMRILTRNNIITTKFYDFDAKGINLNEAIIFDMPLKLTEKNRFSHKYELKNIQIQIIGTKQKQSFLLGVCYIPIGKLANKNSFYYQNQFEYQLQKCEDNGYLTFQIQLKRLFSNQQFVKNMGFSQSDHTMITETSGVNAELFNNSNIIAVSRNRINIEDKVQENTNTYPDEQQEIDQPRMHTPEPIILPENQNNGLCKKFQELNKKLQYKYQQLGESKITYDKYAKINTNENKELNFTTFRNEQKNEFEPIIEDREEFNAQSAAELNSSIHQKYKKLKKDYDALLQDFSRVKLENLELIQQNKTLLNIMKHRYD